MCASGRAPCPSRCGVYRPSALADWHPLGVARAAAHHTPATWAEGVSVRGRGTAPWHARPWPRWWWRCRTPGPRRQPGVCPEPVGGRPRVGGPRLARGAGATGCGPPASHGAGPRRLAPWHGEPRPRGCGCAGGVTRGQGHGPGPCRVGLGALAWGDAHGGWPQAGGRGRRARVLGRRRPSARLRSVPGPGRLRRLAPGPRWPAARGERRGQRRCPPPRASPPARPARCGRTPCRPPGAVGCRGRADVGN
jgi:hypothetical protein